MAVLGFNAAAAVASRATGLRADPYMGYNFLVEMQGILVGGFSQVTGLEIVTDVEEVREGGNNAYAYKLPRPTSYSNIQLVRGLSDMDMLWAWYQDVIGGKVTRRNGTIYLLNHAGVPTMWWNFVRAYPIAWTGPQFDAESSAVVTTGMTLVHEGLTNPASSTIGSLGGLV